MPTIRPYTPSDKPTVLGLFQLNTPRYFHPSEKEGFSNYLDNEREGFFVVEVDDRILGCGGVNYHGPIGMLSWGIIHPEHHGKGIGTLLTNHRISILRSNPEVEEIVVRTSQHTYGFYLKQGFKVVKTEKDYWDHGFDLYYMQL